MLELRHIHKYYNPGTVSEMCLSRTLTSRSSRENLSLW